MVDYETELANWKQRRMHANQHLMPDKFKSWLQENPEPILSDEEHRIKVNICIEKANRLNDDRENKFCPLSGKACVTNCECYVLATVHGTIYENDDETGRINIPFVIGGHCVAYALKGGT